MIKDYFFQKEISNFCVYKERKDFSISSVVKNSRDGKLYFLKQIWYRNLEEDHMKSIFERSKELMKEKKEIFVPLRENFYDEASNSFW